MVMMVMNGTRRRQVSLAVAELAALQLEAHRMLLLAAATAAGTSLVSGRYNDCGGRGRGHDDWGRRYRGGCDLLHRLHHSGRDLLHRLNRSGRDLLYRRLYDLLLDNRLRLHDLDWLCRRGSRCRLRL
jgi:hypothetical protein